MNDSATGPAALREALEAWRGQPAFEGRNGYTSTVMAAERMAVAIEASLAAALPAPDPAPVREARMEQEVRHLGLFDEAGYWHPVGCQCLSDGHCSIELDSRPYAQRDIDVDARRRAALADRPGQEGTDHD